MMGAIVIVAGVQRVHQSERDGTLDCHDESAGVAPPCYLLGRVANSPASVMLILLGSVLGCHSALHVYLAAV